MISSSSFPLRVASSSEKESRCFSILSGNAPSNRPTSYSYSFLQVKKMKAYKTTKPAINDYGLLFTNFLMPLFRRQWGSWNEEKWRFSATNQSMSCLVFLPFHQQREVSTAREELKMDNSFHRCLLRHQELSKEIPNIHQVSFIQTDTLKNGSIFDLRIRMERF